MIFYDTETCGLHGLCVLIQYAIDDGPIELYCPWDRPIYETLDLISWMMEQENVGFNLAFDQFHLCKLYTILNLVENKTKLPEDIIEELAELEPLGRDGLCLKPKAACDIMLHARKTKYQNTMARKAIKIKKIHVSVVDEIRDYLEEHVKIDDIYFANRKNKLAPRWGIFDSDAGDEWKDIKLSFRPSGALKTLAIHALGYSEHEIMRYGNLETPRQPIEVGYAPFALAISRPPHWRAKVKKGSGYARGFTWPALIERHFNYWLHNRLARQYASDDVKFTRELWKHLGSPQPGDNDSELACMVGANRWRGYAIDMDKLDALRDDLEKQSQAAPRYSGAVKTFLMNGMNEEERMLFEMIGGGSTKKTVLEEISKWESETGKRALACLNARQAKYKLDLITKLRTAGRFHASAEIIGALSGRKSGRGGDLNSQGIVREQRIRECFTLAHQGMVLCGGDFDAFEVVLAIAVYNDDKLEVAVKSGKKIHALFGLHVYPDMSYEEILADKEKYTRSKSAVFAMIYGGEAYTLKSRLGVDEETAQEAYTSFLREYPKTAEGRKKVNDMFCSMRQPGGIGTRVEWHEPKQYSETMFGFRRYFTLENTVCKILYNLANKPPTSWKKYQGIVRRRDRDQTVLGSVQSALYAAAFALQSANMRAAGNHVIQGSGAEITKQLERNIWNLQPTGINPWLVQPINEHDEVMCPCVPEMVDIVKETVTNTVESYRPKVSLIAMDWHTNMRSWAEK